MKKTLLADTHIALGAKMAEFAGWSMPIQYEGVLAEHAAVREKAGVFDVSHMGKVLVKGGEVLEQLSVSHIESLKPGKVRYTVWCNEKGGSIDDLMIYRTGEDTFFAVFNASNRDKDFRHLLDHGGEATSCFDKEGILALQGPDAPAIAQKLFEGPIPEKAMEVAEVTYRGHPLWIATTGYTGSGGYEFFVPNALLLPLWNEILSLGAAPVGLGARDTLRLEKGYALYGHELSEEISPLESVSAWAVKTDKAFLGKEALLQRRRRFPYAAVLSSGIAREGSEVWQGEEKIGFVTSGTFSPCLKKGIALILSDRELSIGEKVDLDVRGRRIPAELVRLPFV